MPKLSIIIPVYNVEKYLSKCLDSVIDRRLSDYEVVIVNDGSTDSSPEICMDYAAKYPEIIKFISTENGGLGAARNNGLAAAKGEYVFFLDSDDYVSENAVSEMLDQISTGHDVYLFDLVPVTESGHKIGYIKGCERVGEFSFEDYPELIFCPPNACNKILRKNLFNDTNISFPGRVWFEDLYTIPKLYPHTNKCFYVEKPWYMYLQREGSITRNENIHRNLEIIEAVDQVINYYKKHGQFEKYKEQLEYMVMYHQVITSSTRVILLNKKSTIPVKLFEDYKNKFPEYRHNRYIMNMPKKLKLLMFYIEHHMYRAFNLTMRLNNIIKGKHK